MNTITIDALSRQVLAGLSPRLLDVRSPEEFARVHAAGAVLVPLGELTPASIASARLAGDDPFYVLCQVGSRATQACEKLDALGVNTAVRVDGGTAAWEHAGLPIVRSAPNVMSIERQVRIAAGTLVLIGLLLGRLVHPASTGIAAFVGGGLVFAGITDYSGLGILMSKFPWNRPSRRRPSTTNPF
jgi:rhodanese-related sulfurtransferase